MTEKEILQQQEVNEQKAFYLIAVGMFYHAYGCGAFALARATGYRVLRKHRKHGDWRVSHIVRLPIPACAALVEINTGGFNSVLKFGLQK